MNETTTGAPLTATVGERVGGDPHVRDVQAGIAKAAARRPFPWAALALAAVGWAAVTGMGRVVRRNVRRAGARVAALARRVPVG
jgi:hypothetical protein